mmetsp:Transcript_37550/g.60284  ORF Transcript_37550/g.60284 Transcript_37550/m.60284 type:complete len:344 (-) Transcript_37550:431-1462(-)
MNDDAEFKKALLGDPRSINGGSSAPVVISGNMRGGGVITVNNKSFHNLDKVSPKESLLRYFHVEVRGDIIIQGIVSPLRQVVSKYIVDTYDKSLSVYKDTVADVMNKHLSDIAVGEWKSFERKGSCRVIVVKEGIDCEAERAARGKGGEPTKGDDEEYPTETAPDNIEETEVRPRSLEVCICCAARTDFSLSENFVRELKTAILVAVPFSELTLMDLGFLAQNEKIQNRVYAVCHKLVQRHGLDKLLETRKQVAEVKEVMHRNIEAALERGEDLQEVCEKTEELTEDSMRFRKTTVQIRRRHCCAVWRSRIIGGICCLLLVAIVAVIAVFIFHPPKNMGTKKK